MSLGALLAGIEATGTGEVPPEWQQGRTTYGGLSSAIAYRAARASLSEPPPLRSAQIAFAGPLSGKVVATTRLLRRGRSAAFVTCELTGDDGPALSAQFVFGAARPSALAGAPPPRPEHASLPPGAAPHVLPDEAPRFVRNFALADAVPREARRRGELMSWMRLADDGLDPVTTLVLLGDGLPPAAFVLGRERGPVSSMTWQFDLLSDAPATRDGWWLLRSCVSQAGDGFSSQVMAAWDADGRQVLAGMQMVALFM